MIRIRGDDKPLSSDKLTVQPRMKKQRIMRQRFAEHTGSHSVVIAEGKALA